MNEGTLVLNISGFLFTKPKKKPKNTQPFKHATNVNVLIPLCLAIHCNDMCIYYAYLLCLICKLIIFRRSYSNYYPAVGHAYQMEMQV